MTVAEREELAASVTHWMQMPHLKFPFLSAKMRRQLAELAGTGAPVFQYNDVPYPPPSSSTFTFVDLFAGIGGFRQAFQNLGGKCVFTSEWDAHAKKTYATNCGEAPYGDICRIDKSHIPDHDVLCAGFPCQPFSLAGVSKKNSLGRKHGFEDETQGTRFFEIKEILRIKKPKAFFLENVKNLLFHDRGKTFEVS